MDGESGSRSEIVDLLRSDQSALVPGSPGPLVQAGADENNSLRGLIGVTGTCCMAMCHGSRIVAFLETILENTRTCSTTYGVKERHIYNDCAL